jgi:hypothetical protein
MSLFLELLLTWFILTVIVGLIVSACTHLIPERRRDPHANLPVTGPAGPA